MKRQNLIILVASYVFYGWWDWRFLSLMFISSLIDFLIGKALDNSTEQKKRKALLWASVVGNIGLLGFFKYHNFFVDTLILAFAQLGIDLGERSLNVVLPIGISFYTFQTLSYTIDIYKRKIQATNDPLAYFTFVSFFPQLVSGPIERAKNLLPQFEKAKTFDYQLAKDGLRQILWGLFKKVVIADVLGETVDKLYLTYDLQTGSTLLIGIPLFAIQVYADFSAYADIAIGTGKLFGVRLMRNFAYPFFATHFADFWRRWHISLSLWFRDYVYFPLGGNRRGGLLLFRNIMITFILSGIWHGSDTQNFAMMGVLHGTFVWLSVLLIKRNHDPSVVESDTRLLPYPKQLLQMLLVFSLFSFPTVFFRAPRTEVAIGYFSELFSASLFTRPAMLTSLFPALVLLTIDWFNRHKEHPLMFDRWPTLARWATYYTLIFFISNTHIASSPYIYFQF